MLHNSKESKVKGNFKKENNQFRDSPHQDPLSRGSQSIESKYSKSQVNVFHKTRDSRTGNLRTDFSNKSQLE